MSPTAHGRTRYEKLLATGGSGLPAGMAAASRATRAALAVERPSMPGPRADVVAGVAGPLMAGFVLWSLRQAEQRGLRRLYFVARDGEVMLRMSRPLAQAVGADLDLRYLEGSRRTWTAAAASGEHDRAWLASLLEREESATVRSGLDWVRLTPERLAATLTRAGLPPGSWDDELDNDGRRRLVEVLHCPEVVAAVAVDERRRAAAARAYLDDVGLLEPTPYGIVDGAGHANIGRLLTGLVVGHGGSPPAVECYYGLQGPGHAALGRQPLGYAYDEWRGSPGRQVTDLWVALEMWTAATHGRVEGYEFVDGRARPMHGQVNSASEEWGMPDVRFGLERYAEELAALVPGIEDPWADVRSLTATAAAAFWEHPTRQEVLSWGDYPFEASSDTYPVAEGFTTAQVLRSLRRGRLRTRRRGSWPAGTRMTATPHLRVLLGVSMVVRRALGTLGRRAQADRSRTLAGDQPPAVAKGTAHRLPVDD